MLRRVVQAFRLVMLLSGTILLALIPLSLLVHITATCPWPTASASEENWQVVVLHVGTEARYGTLRIGVLEEAVSHQRRVEWRISSERAPAVRRPLRLTPTWDHSSPFLVVYVPLWLLAALCLAWPVTSLLLARRRRKGRGFEVEVTSDE